MKYLLVEDDARLAELTARGLRRRGHVVDEADSIEDAQWFTSEFSYDVIILDVMLPDGDGFSFCDELRSQEDWTPVLMLTARDAVDDRVRGLDVGADDYLVKPFAFAELEARLRALARRPANGVPTELRLGALCIDLAAHRVFIDGAQRELTSRQFALLEFFMRHPDVAFSRGEILEGVWDWAFDGTPRIVDVYVGALRKSLGSGPSTPQIETVRGTGYALRPPPRPPGTPEG